MKYFKQNNNTSPVRSNSKMSDYDLGILLTNLMVFNVVPSLRMN